MLTLILNSMLECLQRVIGCRQAIDQLRMDLEQRLDAQDAILLDIHIGLFGSPGAREASEALVALSVRASDTAVKSVQLSQRLKSLLGGN